MDDASEDFLPSMMIFVILASVMGVLYMIMSSAMGTITSQLPENSPMANTATTMAQSAFNLVPLVALMGIAALGFGMIMNAFKSAVHDEDFTYTTARMVKTVQMRTKQVTALNDQLDQLIKPADITRAKQKFEQLGSEGQTSRWDSLGEQ